MRKFILLAACLFVATSAFAQSLSSADFVTQAVTGDMFEIESSKLATQKGDANAGAFVSKIAKDHTEAFAELKSLVDSGKVKAVLPASIDKPHQEKLDKLAALKGGDFDRNFLEIQVNAHKEAIPLFERYSKEGDNDALKAFAAKYLPRLQEHLKMARDLQQAIMQE